MRNAGLCEVVVATVTTQAISAGISMHGCLAIGILASDQLNQDRLSTAGACEVNFGIYLLLIQLLSLKKNIFFPNKMICILFIISYIIIITYILFNRKAVVGAVKRHDDDENVVINACFAVHHLSYTTNNISWMGANGGCEVSTYFLFLLYFCYFVSYCDVSVRTKILGYYSSAKQTHTIAFGRSICLPSFRILGI